MNKYKPYLLLIVSAFFYNLLNNIAYSQSIILEGMLSSESKAIILEKGYFLSYKEYIGPTSTSQTRNSKMMTYVDLPVHAKEVFVEGDLFESKIAYIEKNKIKWKFSLGKTNNSRSPTFTTDHNGNVYSGEKIKGVRSIKLFKISPKGREIWSTKIDTLDNVYTFYENDSDELTVLASFNNYRKVNHGEEYSIKREDVFVTIKLNKRTGKLLSQRINQGPSYFCNAGYSRPLMKSHRTHYFFKNDTLVYSRADTMQMLTLAQDKLIGSEIKSIWGNDKQFFVLTKKNNHYSIILERWAGSNPMKKEIKTDIPETAKNININLVDEKLFISFELDNNLRLVSFDAELNQLASKVLLKELNENYISNLSISEDESALVILISKNQNKKSIITQTLNLK